MKNSKIYFDNAATTYVDPRVLASMLPYFSEEYGNAESLHSKGKSAKIAIDSSRETVAKILNCHPSEIIFTSGGTESNNLAIFGTARANKNKGNHLLTTVIEHSSVLEPFRKLETEGFEVTYLKVDNEGFVNPDDLLKAIRPDTIMASVMYANNEIGTIEPIKKLGEICKNKKIIFHTDACQAAGFETLNVEDLNVDLLTINAGKIYGPKGVGALYIRKNTKIEPIIYGGGHENGLRGGTHNIPGIVGLAKALELTHAEQKIKNAHLIELRDILINEILSKIKNSKLNGPNPLNPTHASSRLPNNINFSIKGIESQNLLLQLDEAGICVSTGAACGARSTKPSHVLQAIGISQELIDATIRVTIGKQTTKNDINYFLDTLTQITKKLFS